MYKKETDGTFQAVTVDGDPDSAARTLLSGTPLQLPAGSYWLKETVPEGILDPAEHAALYEGELKGGTFYFGPFVLEEVTDKEGLTQTFAVVNYAQEGAVEVKKLAKGTDGALNPLSGAEIAIYQGEKVVKTVSTGADGKAVFQDLPIYDEDGKPITYTIRETQAPKGYTCAIRALSVQLQPGKTVTADARWKQPLQSSTCPSCPCR